MANVESPVEGKYHIPENFASLDFYNSNASSFNKGAWGLPGKYALQGQHDMSVPETFLSDNRVPPRRTGLNLLPINSPLLAGGTNNNMKTAPIGKDTTRYGIAQYGLMKNTRLASMHHFGQSHHIKVVPSRDVAPSLPQDTSFRLFEEEGQTVVPAIPVGWY